MNETVYTSELWRTVERQVTNGRTYILVACFCGNQEWHDRTSFRASGRRCLNCGRKQTWDPIAGDRSGLCVQTPANGGSRRITANKIDRASRGE